MNEPSQSVSVELKQAWTPQTNELKACCFLGMSWHRKHFGTFQSSLELRKICVPLNLSSLQLRSPSYLKDCFWHSIQLFQEWLKQQRDIIGIPRWLGHLHWKANQPGHWWMLLGTCPSVLDDRCLLTSSSSLWSHLQKVWPGCNLADKSYRKRKLSLHSWGLCLLSLVRYSPLSTQQYAIQSLLQGTSRT